MISFTQFDILILFGFFALVLGVGFWAGKSGNENDENYLLSGRKVGLTLFILTNVSTWYGGILGVGEFTYYYGLASWFTQGFPYYIFAIIFALFFARKIRETSLYTIPDVIEKNYGRYPAIIISFLIFILVSPAPYLLMVGSLFSVIFEIHIAWGILIGILLSILYLFKGGYKSDLYTDVVLFFVMFIGFVVIVYTSVTDLGGLTFLENNLPESHLNLTGGASYTFLAVWFLIAIWTFTDPGFHQRCYAAKTGSIAVKGILISIVFWFLFDFLTTSTGLYAAAHLKEIDNPVLAFPLYAEEILGSGLKGLFYAGLFATIISTLNSFLFLSATTFSKDFVGKIFNRSDHVVRFTRIGLYVSSAIAIVLALLIPSVINIWYTIGSLCIPGIIFLIIGAYFNKFAVSKNFALIEIAFGTITSLIWFVIRPNFSGYSVISEIEPMIIGLITALIIHLVGVIKNPQR